MLHIEPDTVIADATHYFGEPGVRNAAYAGDLNKRPGA